jgi:hypothetical protein
MQDIPASADGKKISRQKFKLWLKNYLTPFQLKILAWFKPEECGR